MVPKEKKVAARVTFLKVKWIANCYLVGFL